MGDGSPARRRAGWLLYAAVQFCVLTAIAMLLYPGGTWFDPTTPHYRFFENFLSDLGATRAFSGRPNHVGSAIFCAAMVSIGSALVAFSWSWRSFGFNHGRARAAGITSQVAGTLSGLAFVGIGCTPWNLVLAAHNLLVVIAFTMLLAYVAGITVLLWRNEHPRGRTAANLAYLGVVLGYVVLVLFGPRLSTPTGHHTQVAGQKLVVYASMIHIGFLTDYVRRRS